jgi:hypothetical protein
LIGTFCFFGFRGYGWYLSSTAMFLYLSWIIHNIVAWMKIKPFFMDSRSMFKPETGKWVRRIYLGTLALTVPFICWQIANNYRFFNNINDYYVSVRPYEPLMRDPWWVFTCLTLFHVINSVYGTGVFELIKRSPRFAILLIAICLALIFTAVDIAASIHNFTGSTDGYVACYSLLAITDRRLESILGGKSVSSSSASRIQSCSTISRLNSNASM